MKSTKPVPPHVFYNKQSFSCSWAASAHFAQLFSTQMCPKTPGAEIRRLDGHWLISTSFHITCSN